MLKDFFGLMQKRIAIFWNNLNYEFDENEDMSYV